MLGDIARCGRLGRGAFPGARGTIWIGIAPPIEEHVVRAVVDELDAEAHPRRGVLRRDRAQVASLNTGTPGLVVARAKFPVGTALSFRAQLFVWALFTRAR